MVLRTHHSHEPIDAIDALATYRAARTQDTLFEPHRGAYDEFVDDNGVVRPAWHELADAVNDRGRAGLDELRHAVRESVDRDGITYVQFDRHGETVTDGDGVPVAGTWELDALPVMVSAEDWNNLESGLVQRSRLLDAVLADLYGERASITSGVLPAELLFSHPGYVRAARGIAVPGRHQLFLHGCDVSRRSDGQFVANGDWTQAPSGAGYALADRRVIAHAVPDLYERVAPRPASPWAQALRLALIDAAPEAAQEPVVVVLSPGIHSETAFDQAYLAGALGFPLVESADLVVRDGKLWMRSLGTLKRVDVVLRRVDAEYADPLDLRPDSRLGVVGLVEVLRRGAVTVVNTLGSGILESPAVLRFLPDLAQLLTGETPELASVTCYWGGYDHERSHLLANLDSLLIHPVDGAAPIVGPALTQAARTELAARIAATPTRWIGQELPEFSCAPIDLLRDGMSVGNIGMRLFTVAQRGGYAPMVGGLGYVLARGNGAHTMNTVAAKDIWVRTSGRVTAVSAQPLELPVITPSPTRAISSPRVLSDLFWLGRYAERAESTARLLTVTRERHHEYRHRRGLTASECVPVLLTALGRITGADTGAGGDDDEQVATTLTTLWALTADRHQSGSLAQSIERLGLAARAVRDQMSQDTWMVLAAVERAVLKPSDTARRRRRELVPPESKTEGETYLAAAHNQTLAGMLALSGIAAESMVRDVGWTVMDIGKRIERGLGLTALLRGTLTTARSAEAERTVIESVLVVCESAVMYRRRTVGQVSVAAVADLVLFDAENPRSLVFQLDLLRSGLRMLPSSTGSTRPERLVEEIAARLRRLDPADLEHVHDDGQRAELAGLLDGIHADLRELSDLITATHFALPSSMLPLWGPDERRTLP